VAGKAYKGWARAKGFGLYERSIKTNRFDEFHKEVGEAIWRPKGEHSPDKWVNQAADQTRDQMREMLEFAQRHGVRGLENVAADETWLMRIWSIEKITKADADRPGWLQKAVTQGLQRANPGIDDKLANKWASGIIRIVKNTDKYTELQRSQVFNGEATELMRDALAEGGMIEEDIENLMKLVGREAGPAPISARARKRNQMDINTVVDGVALNTVLENNAATLMTIYTKQIVGASMISQVLEEMSRISGREMTTLPRLMDYLRNQMKEAGMSDKATNSDIDKIEIMFRSIAGRRLHPSKKHTEFFANVRAANFLSRGGQFGIAQIPEFGALVGAVGLRAALRQMPALGSIFKRAQNGDLNNRLLHEMETFVGVGLGGRNNQVLDRIDSDGQLSEIGKATDIANRGLRQAGRFMSYANLMTPITVLQERWAIALAAQTFFDRAVSGRTFGKSRLASLGLTPEDGELISGLIRKYSSREESAVGGPRLVQVNFHLWGTDVKNIAQETAEAEAASRFIGALQRWSNRVVQTNDIGNLSKWMTGDMGRVISQFKTFSLVAWEKQFLARGAMMIDGARAGEPEMAFQPFMEMILSVIVGGGAYVAQTYTNSAFKDNREEYLEEKLSFNRIAAVAFMRSAWAGFIPDALDQILWFGGQDESIFTGRNSGLNTFSRSPESFFFANPSTAAIGDLMGTGHEAFTFVTGQESFSQKDFLKGFSLLPFARLTPMLWLADSIAGNLPDE
jgi:hypothetical protein